jgi:hypothetical protein
VSDPLALAAFGKSVWPLLGGVVLAVLFGRWGDRLPRMPLADGVGAAIRPVRGATVALGGILERSDEVLRRWPIAGLSLLLLAIAFGALLELGR